MPLQKQTVDIPLAVGLDTKTDPKQTKRLTELVNAYIERSGEIRRRPGTRQLTQAVQPQVAATLSGTPHKLIRADAVYGGPNGEVLLRGRSSYEKNTTTAAAEEALATDMIGVLTNNKSLWRTTLQTALVKHDLARVTKSSSEAFGSVPMSSSTIIEGERYRMFVYTRSTTRDVFVTIVDKDTGTKIIDGQEISNASSYTDFRGLHIYDATLGWVFIVLIRGETGGTSTAIQQWVWNPATPYTISAVSNIVTDIDNDATAENLWDAKELLVFNSASTKEKYAIAYRDTGNVLRIRLFNGTNTSSFQTQVSTGVPSEKGLSIVAGVDSAVYIHFVETSGTRQIWLEYYDTGSNTFPAGPVSVDTVPAAITTVSMITSAIVPSYFTDTPTSQFLIVYGLTTGVSSLISQKLCRAVSHLTAGTAVGTAATFESVVPVSRIFVRDRKAYAIFEIGTDLDLGTGQRSFFLAEIGTYAAALNLHWVTKIASLIAAPRQYETIGGIQYSPTLANVVRVYSSDPQTNMAAGSATYRIIDSPQFVTVLPVQDRLIITSGSEDVLLSHAEVTLDFDPKPPRGVLVGRTAMIGGGIVYGFDSMETHEVGFHVGPDFLSPSQSVGGSISDGDYHFRAIFEWTDNNGQIYRSVPSPAEDLTIAAGGGTASVNVSVAVPYELTDRLSRFSRVLIVIYAAPATSEIYTRVGHAAMVAGSTQTINVVRADSPTSEAIYTTGGVIENIGPPASWSLAASESRAYLISQDDPFGMWFSKFKQANEGVAFSDSFTQRIEMDGPDVAVAVIDGAVVRFKRNDIYIVTGDGPNDLGLGAFNTPRKVSSGIGCRNYASVAESDVGVFFESDRGIYLLTKQLTVEFIGAPLFGLGGISVRSASVVPRLSQVRFVRDGTNQLLVFDYENGIWSVWEYDTVLRHGGELPGNGFFLCGSGGKVLLEDPSKDDGKVALTTSWVSTQSLNGYERLYWIYLLGQIGKNVRLTVQIYYDYKDDVLQTVELDGSESQWRIKPKLQKCTAFKIRIAEKNDSRGELRLSALSLVIGQKKSYRPIRKASR